MLKTPPQPRKKKGDKPAQFVVLDGQLRVVDALIEKGRSTVTDVFRNLQAYAAGRPMERQVRLLA